MGAELIINPERGGLPVLEGRAPRTPRSGAGSARRSQLTGGEDPDIVFEHPGRETFASVFAARKGGTIVTMRVHQRLHAPVRQPLPVDEPQADHRLALRELPRGLGGQPAHRQGPGPTLSRTDGAGRPGRARRAPYQHQGKVGVLCLTPEEGLGVRDEAKVAKHLDAINRFGASDPHRQDRRATLHPAVLHVPDRPPRRSAVEVGALGTPV